MDLSTIAQISGFFVEIPARVDWHPSCCSSIVFTFQHPPKKTAFLTGHTFKAVFFCKWQIGVVGLPMEVQFEIRSTDRSW